MLRCSVKALRCGRRGTDLSVGADHPHASREATPNYIDQGFSWRPDGPRQAPKKSLIHLMALMSEQTLRKVKKLKTSVANDLISDSAGGF
jgi:hypothetical protein